MRKPGVVKSSFPVSGSDDRVVLLFWGLSKESRLRNVVRVGRDGLVKWRAELPGETERDCFVRLERRGEAFVARTYAGHEVCFGNDGAVLDGRLAS